MSELKAKVKDLAGMLPPKPAELREWEIYHYMGSSGIAGPHTHKTKVVEHTAYAKLEAENARLRAALEAISNRGCYHCSDDAREALK